MTKHAVVNMDAREYNRGEVNHENSRHLGPDFAFDAHISR
jgi:hypothetical protein